MALPAGALTATVTVGAPIDIAGAAGTLVSLHVRPDLPGDTPLVWAADGTPIQPWSASPAAGEAPVTSASLEVLADQPGVLTSSTVDGAAAMVEIRSWPLVATWVTRQSATGAPTRHVRRLNAPAPGETVDLDLLPADGVTVPATVTHAQTINIGGTGIDTEGVQDVVGAMVAAAGGTYDDAAGTITLPSGGATRGLVITETNVAAIPAGSTADNLAAYYNSGTAPITVQGTSIAAGSHAVWAWVSGAWALLASGTGGTPPDGDIIVTPAAPTHNDEASVVGDLAADSYRIPATTGVDYKIGGVTQAPGDYSVGNIATTIVVTAVAQSGYALSGTDSWTFVFHVASTWTMLAEDTFEGAAIADITGRALTTGAYTWAVAAAGTPTDRYLALDGAGNAAFPSSTAGNQFTASMRLSPAPTMTPIAYRVTMPYAVTPNASYGGSFRFSVNYFSYSTNTTGTVVLSANSGGTALSFSMVGTGVDAFAITGTDPIPLAGTAVFEAQGTNWTFSVDGTTYRTGTLPGTLRTPVGRFQLGGGSNVVKLGRYTMEYSV